MLRKGYLAVFRLALSENESAHLWSFADDQRSLFQTSTNRLCYRRQSIELSETPSLSGYSRTIEEDPLTQFF